MAKRYFSIPLRILDRATPQVIANNLKSKLIIHGFDLDRPYKQTRNEEKQLVTYTQEIEEQ